MEALEILIVDDEPAICESLQRLISNNPRAVVVGVCHDGDEALEAARKLNPDLIFLDIRMPGMSGLEVARTMGKWQQAPTVIFITAYDDYALKAFEVDAVDYILKPFDADDIERAIRKVEKMFGRRGENRLPSKQVAGDKETPICYPPQFCFYKDGRAQIIHCHNILYVCAENREVFVQTVDGKRYSAKPTLQELEGKLDPQRFFRCHRNFIANMFYAKELSPGFNRGYLLTLQGSERVDIPVSRAKITQISRYIYI